MIANPLLIKLFNMNPKITKAKILPASFNKVGSFKLREESNSIILAFNSWLTCIFLPYIKYTVNSSDIIDNIETGAVFIKN